MAATAMAENTTEDMTDTVWHDDEWLKYYPLTRATALDYFALSTFSDPRSLNERARQQGLEPSQIPTLAPGSEYVLEDSQEPHLFVIRKQHRSSAAAADGPAHAFYYILDGSIYQAPTLQAMITSRMARCLYSMRAALGKMQQDLDPLVTGEGIDEVTEAEAEAAPPPPVDTLPSRSDRQRVDSLVRSVLREYGTPASLIPDLPTPRASKQLQTSNAT